MLSVLCQAPWTPRLELTELFPGKIHKIPQTYFGVHMTGYWSARWRGAYSSFCKEGAQHRAVVTGTASCGAWAQHPSMDTAVFPAANFHGGALVEGHGRFGTMCTWASLEDSQKNLWWLEGVVGKSWWFCRSRWKQATGEI